MSSTPQDPQDEAPVTGTTPEDAPQTGTPDATPPTEPTRTPPTTPPPPWVTSASSPTSSPAASQPPAPSQPSAPFAPSPTTPPPPTAPPTTGAEPTGAPGQHAAPRPYPPSAPSGPSGPGERTPDRPTGFEGAIARDRPTVYTPTGLPPATPPTAPPVAGPPVASPMGGAFPAGGTPAYAAPPSVGPLGAETPSAGPQRTAPAPTVVTPPPPAASAVAPDRPRRELPEPPPKPGIGRHLLAGVLGLVLTPFAMLLIGVGTSRLADIAGTNDMGTDLLGTSLLALGLALLAAIVLLGAWSVVLPVVGGLVWGVVLGLAYLMFPVTMEDSAAAMTSSGSVPVAIEQLADAAMTGYLLVLGTLMIAAGVATAIARRRGRRWAERVAVAERAHADAAREDAALVATPDRGDAGPRVGGGHRLR